MIYDAAIAGASLAGLYCGMKLALHGWKVCVCDRRSQIGLPVRCGEVTGNREELARFVTIDEAWIAGDVDGCAVHLNDHQTFSKHIPHAGVLLHRDRFEKNLADRAVSSGMHLRLNSRITGLARDGSRVHGISLDNGSVVEARVIIGADGAESSIGQWAGISRPLALSEAFTSAQYTIKSDFPCDRLLHFYIGSDTIPNGYIWVFFKDNQTLSVGAGFYGANHPQAKAKVFLDRFIASHMPGCAPQNLITGCVPLALCPRRLFSGNVAVIGDAARQCNPLTAGGIMNTLEAADLLAQNLILSKNADSYSDALHAYSRAWCMKARREQKAFLLFKEIFMSFNDAQRADLISGVLQAFKKPIDRQHPYRFPYIAALRLGVRLLPKIFAFRRVLWQ